MSVAYRSIALHLRRTSASPLRAYAYVSNFKWRPNISENWEQDMARGPRGDLHAEISIVLQSSLSDLVSGTIHAVAPDILRRRVAP